MASRGRWRLAEGGRGVASRGIVAASLARSLSSCRVPSTSRHGFPSRGGVDSPGRALGEPRTRLFDHFGGPVSGWGMASARAPFDKRPPARYRPCGGRCRPPAWNLEPTRRTISKSSPRSTRRRQGRPPSRRPEAGGTSSATTGDSSLDDSTGGGDDSPVDARGVGPRGTAAEKGMACRSPPTRRISTWATWPSSNFGGEAPAAEDVDEPGVGDGGLRLRDRSP